MEVDKKQAQWRCYKPNKENKGAASRLELKVTTKVVEKNGQKYDNRDVQLFWVSSPQTGVDSDGNASFAWSIKDDPRTVTLKIGEADIGELLSVLNGKKKNTGGERGLYHKNQNGSTSFNLEAVPDRGYRIRIARQDLKGKVDAVSHTISFGEGEILRVLLDAAVKQTYQW